MYLIYLALGFICILIMAIQDYKTMHIDSRYNYLMLGATILLINNFVTAILFGAGLLTYIFFRFSAGNVFTPADYSVFYWLIPGFYIINPMFAVVFFLYLWVYLVVEIIVKKLARTTETIAPAIPMVLFAFFVAIAGGYLLTYLILFPGVNVYEISINQFIADYSRLH